MTKKNSFRILSLILSLAILAISCLCSAGVISFAGNSLKSIEDSESKNMASMPELKGDYHIPFSISDYDSFPESNVDANKSLSKYSNVSITKNGINDSFALKISGQDAKEAFIKIGDSDNVIRRNKTYIISMQIKKSGTVNSLKTGLNISSGLAESSPVTNSGISETEWTEFKFEYTVTTRNPKLAHIYLSWDIAEDSVLYIDNISIKDKSDSAGFNIISNGTFDRDIYLDTTIDNNPVEDAFYAEKAPSGITGMSLAKEEGYKGSYALKLIGNASSAEVSATGYIGFDNIGVLENNTEYIVEFKAKKSSNLSEFSIGIRESSTEHRVTSIDKQIINDYMFDSGYALYRIKYTTDSTASSGRSRIIFSIKSAESSYVLIDDISIYKSSDENKVSIIKNGSFDAMRIVSNTDAAWETVKIPHVIEEYDCIPNYSDEYHLPLNETVSIDKVGVEESYALKIEGNGSENKGNIKLGTNDGYLKGGTEYTVSFKMKKFGSVDLFNAGLVYDWNNNFFNFVPTDDWQEYSFNITPVNDPESGNTGWNHILLKWKLPSGSELYIDDISVYKTDDEAKTNLFNKGAFDATAHEESPVDETPVKGALYSPAALEEEPMNAKIVENQGVKGSYGVKLEGTGKSVTAQIRYDNRPGLQNYTEYYVEFKAKKSGNVSSFAAGIREQYTNHVAISFGNAQSVNSRISDDFYNYYRVKYTTDGTPLGSDGKGAWTYVTFTFTADEGAYILIDDIKIYETDDEEEYNTFRKGSFDYRYYDLEFDNSDDGSRYIPRKITEYSKRHNFYVTGTEDEINSTISIAPNEGVKGSSALKIEGTGVNNCFKISMNSLSELVNDADYRIGLKVKIESNGNAIVTSETFFQYGLVERWNRHYTLNFSGAKFRECLSNEYHYYQFEYTTDKNCDRAWSYMLFNYNIPEGMSLYIDDIELIPISEKANWITDGDGNPINLLRKSTFDMKDLGQDDANFTDVKPMNVTPVLTYSDTSLDPYVATVTDAPSGSYCLAFGFDDKPLNGSHLQYITPSMPGESYKITFWVKVIGEVENAAFYMSDGRWLNHTYGVDFSQYETGKWTKFEIIYNDKTTPYEAETYRRIKFELEAPAGSGMLIDNITVTRVDCDYESFDVFGGGIGDFEQSDLYPEIAWDKNDRFIYKEGE